MKQTKNLASLLAAASIAAVATPASAIVVGGINFGTLGESPFNTHLETATLAQQIVTGNGQSSMVYGFIESVNGQTLNYCGAGFTSNCSLYYVATFSNSQNFSAGYVEFTSATVDIYYHNTPTANLLSLGNSPDNINFITSSPNSTLWASFVGHNNLGGAADPNAVVNATGLFAGSSLSFSGSGLFDVVLGAGVAGVADFLNANGIADAAGGFADVALTSSANNNVLNPFDVAAGLTSSCGSATPVAGQWCFQGTANIRGNTQIPEPASLALLAAGLGMFGFSRRSKQL